MQGTVWQIKNQGNHFNNKIVCLAELIKFSNHNSSTDSSMIHSVKYIYFVNSNPDTIGAHNFRIPRNGILNTSGSLGVARTYDISYFMESTSQ